MNNLIYDTRFLFQEYLPANGCCSFNIPEYQRGYKWTANNVRQLLDDLKGFSLYGHTADEFYCLQNITIAKKTCGVQTYMNVIDGQQRLTTLFIIISYIQRKLAHKIIPASTDIMKYSVRDSTDAFLKEKVQTGILWDEDIKPECAVSKDQYYIMEVARAVDEWFRQRELPAEVVLDRLKLIVNVVDDGEEETVFASLNGGKVDLDGADLVRAIMITRAARQKYPTVVSEKDIRQTANGDIDMNIHISVSSQGKIHEYRVKLGVEIDQMALWWADKDVMDYFEQLLPNRIAQNKSFKYRDYPIDLLYYAFYEAYKQKLPTDDKDLQLRHFENGIDLNGRPGDEHLEFYSELKELHLTLMDWYNDAETYNLIGYLMYNFKSEAICFERIYYIWKEAKEKTLFKDTIKRIIRYQLATLYGDTGDGEDTLRIVVNGETVETVEDNLVCLRKDILNTSAYNWYESGLTSKILPLLDILPHTTERRGRTRQVIMPLKQRYFKHITSEEDKEHVRSQTRKIDNEDNMTEEDRQMLLEENRKGLNSIGNIVLLPGSVNKSYGNSPLILKMVRIYSEHVMENEQTYIRPHTLDVFMSKLKNIAGNGADENEVFWSEEDIRRTVKDIDQTLAAYFSLPEIAE